MSTKTNLLNQVTDLETEIEIKAPQSTFQCYESYFKRPKGQELVAAFQKISKPSRMQKPLMTAGISTKEMKR